jgi:CspA family cold shock protein
MKRKKAGIVRWFDSIRGYGFIAPAGGQRDIFAHFSNICTDAGVPCQSLDSGERVTYEEVIDERTMKPQAVNIVPIDR